MRAEVLAVGTELLLGQIIDTNSSWIGEQLALAGIDCLYQAKVGDNMARVIEALAAAVERSDVVIMCGGLGPTQDDLSRDAIAQYLGVPLERDEVIVERIRKMFASRNRPMPDNNLRQADVPVGCRTIPQQPGTAPGLICPLGDTGKLIFAVPGVPYEMREMVAGTVIPELRARAGMTSVIRSRTLRTWGQSESGLAEMLDDRMNHLDSTGEATLAFLASGMEGIKVRVTAKAPTDAEALAVLDQEEAWLRNLLGELVFGLDDTTMEQAVHDLLVANGLTLAVAESVTGGLMASRFCAVPDLAEAFRGGLVCQQGEAMSALLGVEGGPLATADAARAMARGVARLLGADVALATTGVTGPGASAGVEPGTVFLGLWLDGQDEAVEVRLPGDRERIRQYGTISAYDLLRKRLLARAG